jgi:hypothetical protein
MSWSSSECAPSVGPESVQPRSVLHRGKLCCLNLRGGKELCQMPPSPILSRAQLALMAAWLGLALGFVLPSALGIGLVGQGLVLFAIAVTVVGVSWRKAKAVGIEQPSDTEFDFERESPVVLVHREPLSPILEHGEREITDSISQPVLAMTREALEIARVVSSEQIQSRACHLLREENAPSGPSAEPSAPSARPSGGYHVRV